jgi:hypothetical protein
MNRRHFIFAVAAGSRTSLAAQLQQALPATPDPVEKLTPGARPAIVLNHLGFLPDARKKVLFRIGSEAPPKQFSLRELGHPVKPFQLTRPLQSVKSDLGDLLEGDFTDVRRETRYQIATGDQFSVPFAIASDVWRRTLPQAVGYFRWQRCGTAVPGVHPACHLDDARRRDTGQPVDVTGGWHDAGDTRKTMGTTMLNGLGLLHLARNLGEAWDPAGSGLTVLREEVRWGNRYFLKMQDADGRVWDDTARGVKENVNSDNHWTDNQVGTSDDRHVNTAKIGRTQAMFIALEAMTAQLFQNTDAEYAQSCLAAALRCWAANKREGSTNDLAWWTLAGVELYRATGRHEFLQASCAWGRELLLLQEAKFIGSQKMIRGAWRISAADPSTYSDAIYSATVYPAIPGVALLALAAIAPNHADAPGWRDAVRLHLDEYVLPLAARSAYGIIPYGAYSGSPTSEYYRPLAGELTYRYFMPARRSLWWIGTTVFLECHAVLLAGAARLFDSIEYRNLAYRQLEWVMGGNPFGACLMTGEGSRNPYPHSPFVGLIPGGIMNGIAGNTRDEPVLDMEQRLNWRTNEYWGPMNAYYIWAVSLLQNA